MPYWTKTIVLAGGGLLVAGVAAVGVGTAAWRRDSARMVARLLGRAAAAAVADGAPVTGGNASQAAEQAMALETDALPAPVARYFAFAFPDGDVAARTVRIRWTGEFRIGPDAGWLPLTAEQHFTVRPPGFLWDARIRMLPLVPVHVRDTYDADGASMRGRIGGLVTVVNQAGTPELAQSALARWIGEAVWFPMALLPREGVRWEAIDDSSARVVVTDGAVTAAAVLHFAATGEPVRMTAMRYRDDEGTAVLTPFEGVYRDFTPIGGIMVPMRAEVAWLLPEARYAYWRGTPEEIRFH